ncbi:MAG TPA: DinB family protein [Longimicrobiaceae bacterium]|nr:DinB family protein [Longimicrobiaceae bacterium]
MEEQLLDTWRIHDRINLYLLDAIPPEALGAVSASKGRTVGEQFAHLHNVRLMWLRQAAPELLEGVDKVEKDTAGDRDLLRRSLEASSSAIEALLRQSVESGGRVKGFKPHAVAFLGYLISHESHHRGQIALTLKQAGHPLDRKVAYGIWEWGVR